MRYGLIYRGNLIPLGQAPAVIGRSAACKIVLDDSEVSRRHARLLPVGDRLLVEDMGSANGVYVNGERIEGKQPLNLGDRLVVGGHQFEVTNQAARTKSVKRKRFVTPYAKDAVRRASVDQLWDDEEPGVEPGETTDQTTSLHLMLRAGIHLLDQDRPDEAETAVRGVLLHLLDQVKKAHRGDPGEMSSAAEFALRLGRVAGAARWVDYVLELYAAASTAVPAAFIDEICAAVDRDGEGIEHLPAYLAALRAKEGQLDEALRAGLERLRELARGEQGPTSDV